MSTSIVSAGVTGITPNANVLVAPHVICDSCRRPSGPNFSLKELRGPSIYHRQNIVPYGSQRNSIIADIDQAESQIGQLDKEIASLQEVIQSLKSRRDALDKFCLQERSLLSGIRRLPDEVLQHMFLLGRGDDYVHVFALMDFVQKLTHVCAHWRSVVFSCPRLWARLYIHYTGNTKTGITEHDVHLERFIALSGEVPLDLRLSSVPNVPGDRFMQTLANSAHRWKDVNIDDYGKMLQAIFSRMPQNVIMSNLEFLTIEIPTSDALIPPTPALTHLSVTNGDRRLLTKIILTSAPSLYNFDISDLYNLQQMFVSFPWSQITHFRSINCSYDRNELFMTLSSMENLESLKFYGKANTTKNIVLRKLHTLVLEDYRHYDFHFGATSDSLPVDVLGVITAPALRTFQFLDIGSSAQDIIQFLKRSGCMLEKLIIFKTSLGEGWKAEQLQNIKHLCINRPKNLAQDLRFLTRENRQNGPGVLPKLETLVLRNIRYNAKASVPNLIPMLKSRLPIAATATTNSGTVYLKAVTIVFDRDIDGSDKRPLNEFIYCREVRNSGAVIKVQYGRPLRHGEISETPTESDVSGVSDSFVDNMIRTGMFEELMRRNGVWPPAGS